MDAGDDIVLGHLVAGVIGLSLVRHWYLDGATNWARLAELEDLLGRLREPPLGRVLNPRHRDLDTGYGEWAGDYDGPNELIAIEEAAVRPVLAPLTGTGVRALDAACGTGRHAAYLAGQGCTVTGADRSEAMLEVARGKVPAARFDLADLRRLPYPDGGFDLAIVSLALCHLPDPTDAVRELHRVLRPGGTLIVADPHPSIVSLGGQAFYGGFGDGRPLAWVRNHYHSAATWLRAFRAAGLVVADCQEPAFTDQHIAAQPAAPLYPEANRTAIEGLAALWLWVLRRE